MKLVVPVVPDLSAWDVPVPSRVRRAGHGTQNLVWLLDEVAVLRVYRNLSAERVSAELRLLDVLRVDGGLPFAVPEPIATPDGRTVVDTADGPAVLFRYLPGRPASRSDLALAGEALGRLDAALAELPLELAPVDWRGSLNAVHPAVPSVADLCVELESLLPEDPGVHWLRDNASWVDDRYLRLAQRLPVQITHGDLALSNILIGHRDEVSAILDFEVAGVDVRVSDLVAGLALAVDWGSSCQEAQAAAYRRGYTRVVALASEEEAAIPTLMLRRAVASAVWRAGRWRDGVSTLDEVRERLARVPGRGRSPRWLRT